MSSASNRRRVPRRNFNSSVGCLFRGRYSIVRSQQVGEGGMSIIVPFELEIGDRVVLTFRIPSGSTICVRGEVRYRDQEVSTGNFMAGIQFENLDFHFKRELRNLVASATNENVAL